MLKKNKTRSQPIFNEIAGEYALIAGVIAFLILLGMWFIPNISQEQFLELCNQFVYGPGRASLAPERPEQLTFMFACLVAPLLCILVVKWFDGKLVFDRQAGLFLTAALLIFWFICWGFTDFFKIAFFPYHATPLLLSIPILLLVLFYSVKKIPRIPLSAWCVLAALVFLCQILMCRLLTLSRSEDYMSHEHLNIIMYTVSQAARGGSDWSQYGFYAQLLGPLFRLTGTSVKTVSIIMGLFHFAALMAVFIAGCKWIRHYLLRLGLLAFLFLFCGGSGFLYHGAIEPYFAYTPIRTFFPMLGCLLLWRLNKSDMNRRWLAVCGLVAGAGLLWNIDSGFPVLAAYGGILLLDWELINIVCFGTWAGAGMFSAYFLIYLNSGTFYNFREMLRYQEIFYVSGFMMLPMPNVPAPWCGLAMIYLLALLLGIKFRLDGENKRIARVYIFLAILGLGLFSYYQGRSHDLSFPAVMWPGFLLLSILGDRLLFSHDRQIRALALPTLVAAVLCIGCVISNPVRIGEGIKAAFANNRNSSFEQDIAFIVDHAPPEGTVNIIGPGSGVLYGETGFKAGIKNFNHVENMILIADVERIGQEIMQSGQPVFISLHRPFSFKFPQIYLSNHVIAASSPEQKIIYAVPAKH